MLKRMAPGLLCLVLTVLGSGCVESKAVITLNPGATLERAARIMRREHFGALPIVEKGHVVGILTRGNILDAFVALVSQRAEKRTR